MVLCCRTASRPCMVAAGAVLEGAASAAPGAATATIMLACGVAPMAAKAAGWRPWVRLVLCCWICT